MSDDKEKSRALPQSCYRDPLEQLLARESRTCAGCAHESATFGRKTCLKDRKHGTRCKLYVEGVTGG